MDIEDVQSMSDGDVLALSVKRPDVFAELVSRYERQFMRKAIAILRNREEANDAVQEAFVRIYIAANRFQRRSNATFSSWAYTILVNQCYTAYRRMQRRGEVSLDAEPQFAEVVPDQAGLEAVERAYARDHLVSLVSKLPALLRRVVEAHFIQGMPQAEVARIEGVSNGVVRARIHRAKQALREMNAELELAPETASRRARGRERRSRS